MIRPATPIMHLAELPARSVSRTPVSGFDFAFVLTAALFVLVGCFFMLDLASAHSSGHESGALKFLTETSVWLPALAKVAGKYILLLLASVVNSALIVLLVQSLRTLDSKISRLTPRFSMSGFLTSTRVENIRGKKAHLESQRSGKRREASAIRESSPFLLSPVFR